mmetsp:Transcript_32922/g.63801  ORF Transcript_32922/g.63801 Transcript_32922/m.63801 type:complete len:212 (-) Transcript_32922:757-1392(-)
MAARANSHCSTLASGRIMGAFPSSTASATLWSPVAMTASSHCSRKVRISARGIGHSTRYTGLPREIDCLEPLRSSSSRCVTMTALSPAQVLMAEFGATTISAVFCSSTGTSRVKMWTRSCDNCPATCACNSDAAATSTFALYFGSCSNSRACSASSSPVVRITPLARLPSSAIGTTFATCGHRFTASEFDVSRCGVVSSRNAWVAAESLRP